MASTGDAGKVGQQAQAYAFYRTFIANRQKAGQPDAVKPEQGSDATPEGYSGSQGAPISYLTGIENGFEMQNTFLFLEGKAEIIKNTRKVFEPKAAEKAEAKKLEEKKREAMRLQQKVAQKLQAIINRLKANPHANIEDDLRELKGLSNQIEDLIKSIKDSDLPADETGGLLTSLNQLKDATDSVRYKLRNGIEPQRY